MTIEPLALLALIPLGLIVGSFVGLVAERWPLGEPMLVARSQCRACGGRLTARELVPVASFVWQRGKCRQCGAAIPVDVMVAEIGGAAAAVLAWFAAPGNGLAGFAALAAFLWCLLLLALLDARHLWLPDALTWPLLVAGCALGFADILPAIGLTERLLGAAAGFGLLAAARAGFRWWRGVEGLGAGDAKLLGAIGAWLGLASLPLVLLLGAGLGLAYAAWLRARGAQNLREIPLPLGTCLAVAAAVLTPHFA